MRYADLVELVRRDLNALLSMTDEEAAALVREALKRFGSDEHRRTRALQGEQAQARLLTIDKVVAKLYTDNAEGRLDDDRLRRMVEDLERESDGLRTLLQSLSAPDSARQAEENYARFLPWPGSTPTLPSSIGKPFRPLWSGLKSAPKSIQMEPKSYSPQPALSPEHPHLLPLHRGAGSGGRPGISTGGK